jgi:hypothetical protein
MSEKKTEETTEGRKSHPVDPAKVNKGDLMAFIYYGKVEHVARPYSNVAGEHTLKVKGLNGAPDGFNVIGDKLIVASASADQYHEEVKVTKTQAAELLVSAYNRPFTVCFVKQDNSERTLRGRLVQPEPLLGRSHVEDLDITEPNKMRLVDHRTIKFLILEGVKYVVKS